MSDPEPSGASTGASRAEPPSRFTHIPDEDFYTWRTWFMLQAGQGVTDDYLRYANIRDTLKEEQDCKRCEKWRDAIFQKSPIVTFLRGEIRALGGDIGPHNVWCRRCTTIQGGGVSPDHGILICANRMKSRGKMEDTMAHEMVHAYDYMRFKIDQSNLRHQACMEIRASMLSGECRFFREFVQKGQLKVTQQLQECVRTRAALSVKHRPGVKDDVHAAKLVNEVWESCFNDTRPFDEIFR